MHIKRGIKDGDAFKQDIAPEEQKNTNFDSTDKNYKSKV